MIRDPVEKDHRILNGPALGVHDQTVHDSALLQPQFEVRHDFSGIQFPKVVLEREVLRGIYAAVRSPDWSTVPATLENLAVDTGTDRFSVSFGAVHRAGPVWFEWKGRLEGTPEGRVRFDFDGVARSTFLRNRIGICVLHPAGECAGAACTVESCTQ